MTAAVVMSGRKREAADVFEQAYAQLSSLGRGDSETAGTLLLLYQALGDAAAAQAEADRAVALAEASPQGLDALTTLLLRRSGIERATTPRLRPPPLRHLEPSIGRDHPQTREARRLGSMTQVAGRARP